MNCIYGIYQVKRRKTKSVGWVAAAAKILEFKDPWFYHFYMNTLVN